MILITSLLSLPEHFVELSLMECFETIGASHKPEVNI